MLRRTAMSFLILLVGAAGCRGAGNTPPPADVAVAWNARVLAIAEAEDGFLTLKGVRTAAMMHLAMQRALARANPDADPVLAASEAAYAVARSQYPDRDSVLGAERARWRPPPQEEPRAEQRLGEEAAQAVLASRKNDGWNADVSYRWHPMGPGVYAEFREHSGTPAGFVFGAGWAAARPFALESPDEFRPGPPPGIQTDAYTAAFDEVKEVGRQTSARRTADQTHLAMWWKEFVESSHNRLARELVVADSLDLYRATRLFALLNAAIFDGYVASFDAKFAWNHWRPYTAIRWAAHDGNPATEPDPAWTNLHDHTYAFPSYPSAHGTVCAAAMTVMADVFGADRPFTMTIPEVDAAGPGSPRVANDPPTRSFPGFMAAARECSASRVYLGIHFRYDSDSGTALGRRVGQRVLDSLLQAAPHG